MAFWDEAHGLAFSDSADNRFHILATSDGGATWTRIPPDRLPAALDNEGAFAASGTNLAMGQLAGAAELMLGKPVLAINTATYWYALRDYGIKDRMPGWGSLLSEH